MSRGLTGNSFVAGKSIDVNRPERIAYDPRQHEYPKTLYHPTRKDKAWTAELERLKVHNKLHPEKPELLPDVPAMSIIVQNAEEEAAKIKEGFALRPPKQKEVAA